MITVEKILFLRNVPLFSGMPPGELSRLADITKEVIYPAGSSIIREGEYGDTMYLIVEGEVRVHRGAAKIAVLKEKDYFGEMSILAGEPRSASVTALSDCLLLRINQADFHEMLSGHFDVTLAIIRTLTRRLRQTEGIRPEVPPSDTQQEIASDDQNTS